MAKSLFKAALIGLGLALGATAAPAQEALRIGVEGAYPPFSQKASDGTSTGFDIDIANALCAELKRKCVFVEQDWDGMIPALIARKFDAIVASMGITEERMKRVDFTDKYYYSASTLLSKKGAMLAADAAGTAGKSIGVQRGTAHECYLQKYFPKAQMKQYVTTEELYLDLTNGRLDAVLVDTIPAVDWVKTNAKSGDYAPVNDKLYDVGCFGKGIGIAVRKKDDKLRTGLNGAIKAIRANGTYKKINDKYFSFDVYGPES